ncbi:MAG: deoxyribose-phosphate aldolase [Bifidobacteriaceae bacterium]|jgi:deoxyribose-phosphate aldolase|nr:deoxyribose-phosphate aldolase [Bifidobacteriaceae bacterium]
MIDHTLLKPEATIQEVERHLRESVELGVFGVCVSPCFLPLASTGVTPVTVVGFPSGAHLPQIKAAEAAQAVANGAGEIDMVMNLGRAKASEWSLVTADIAAVRAVVPAGVPLKVIIESAALTEAQIVAACWAAEDAGADWVKTSTGFHAAGGASVQAVALMTRTVAGRLRVKASGGIKDLPTALAMIEAGAERIGCSASAAILSQLP